MTKEQWKEAEHRLTSFPGDVVRLQIDGYHVSIRTEQDKMKLLLAIYVDGCVKGEWIMHDCEIRRRFYQRHIKSLMSKKQKEQLKKESKAVRELVAQHKTEFAWFSPYWNSFRSLKNYLEKQNQSIEWEVDSNALVQ